MGTIAVTVDATAAKAALDITFAPAVTKITVGRRGPDGFTQLIRYGDQITLTAGQVHLEDYEAPLDTPVVYVGLQVVPVGSEIAESAPVTIPSGGYSWLKDPGYPSMNQRLDVVTSLAELTRPARAGVFAIIDRASPVVVTAKRGSVLGELVTHTLTDAARVRLTDLLSRGTVLLLQTPPQYGYGSYGSAYIHIGDALEARVGLAMEQARRWSLPFQVTDRPEGLATQPITGKTWAAVKATYATWTELAASGKSFRRLLEEGP